VPLDVVEREFYFLGSISKTIMSIIWTIVNHSRNVECILHCFHAVNIPSVIFVKNSVFIQNAPFKWVQILHAKNVFNKDEI
jgi:hypothetical protein